MRPWDHAKQWNASRQPFHFFFYSRRFFIFGFIRDEGGGTMTFRVSHKFIEKLVAFNRETVVVIGKVNKQSLIIRQRHRIFPSPFPTLPLLRFCFPSFSLLYRLPFPPCLCNIRFSLRGVVIYITALTCD